MNLIYIGKIINTHALKGEVKILSDFEYKKDVFKIKNKLYVLDDELEITSYRTHKNYDMVTFKNIDNIDDVLKYKGQKVYINRDEYNFKLLSTDLIGMEVYYNDEYKGTVIDLLKSNLYTLIKVKNKKEYLIPNIKEFIKDIDVKNKKIYINYIKGLEDEN